MVIDLSPSFAVPIKKQSDEADLDCGFKHIGPGPIRHNNFAQHVGWAVLESSVGDFEPVFVIFGIGRTNIESETEV